MSQEIQLRLGNIIVELYQVLSLQKFSRHVATLSDAENKEIAEWVRLVLDDWHECHEFDEASFANPVLIRALLVMYSDTLASDHEAQEQSELPSLSDDVIRQPQITP